LKGNEVTEMDVYTVVILNKEARTLAPDRLETMTFKTFYSAAEYICDFLVDEGLIEMDEVSDVQVDLDDNHVFTIGNLEFYITTGQLNNW
jgi:hypothetical protein